MAWRCTLLLCYLFTKIISKNCRNCPEIIGNKTENVPIHTVSHDENDFHDLNYFPSYVTTSKLFQTGPFPLNSSLICHMMNHTRSVFDKNCHNNTELVVFVISAPANFYLRQNIRSMYGKDSPSFHKFKTSKSTKKHCILFSVGYTPYFRLNQRVDWETYTEGDIIRVPLIESYRETAHKIILTLFLLNKINGSFRYILKTDDDIFIKMKHVASYIRKLNETQVFTGHVAKNKHRIKDPSGKWYVSDLDYPGEVYRPYILGFCELFERNIIDKLAVLHSKTRLIPMEDIHISYLVTKLGYNLTDEPRFHYCNKPKTCRGNFFVDIGKNIKHRNQMISLIKSEQRHQLNNIH